jgi:hypothetical protein
MKKEETLLDIISKISTKETPFYVAIMESKGMTKEEAWKDYKKKKKEGYFKSHYYY